MLEEATQRGQSGWTKVHWAGDILPSSVKGVGRAPVGAWRADVGRENMKRRQTMNNIFYIIGVVVVVAMVLGYFGLR